MSNLADGATIPLKRLITSIESGVSVNAIDVPAENGQVGVLKTSCVYAGHFDSKENKTVVAEDIGRVACPVRANTLVVSRMNTPDLVGAAGLVMSEEKEIYLPDRLWQIHFDHEASDPRFVYWWTRSELYRDQVKMACAGTSSSMQNLDQASFRGFAVPDIKRSAQTYIANFLDEKTARIDALIAEKHLLLDKLSELRSSTISDEVVIRKAGWRQTRLKYLTIEIVDTEHKTAPFFDDGQYLVVRTSNVKAGQLVLENAKYTNQAGFEEWTRRGIPSENDILFTREAPAGEACLVPAGIPLCVGQRTVLLRLDQTKAYPSFVLWSLYGGLASRFIEDLSQGSTVAHFNMPDIGNIPLFTGPVEEQKSHAQALEDKLNAIDELVSHATGHIDRLREYRSSLISAAVTGQLDTSTFECKAEMVPA